MPESSLQWWERAHREMSANGPRSSEYTQWDIFPWNKDWSVKELEPPVDEPLRRGLNGEDCYSCLASSTLDNILWADDLFFLNWARETSLPFAAFLMPRRHCDLATLTKAEAARQGELLAAIERVAIATTGVPRIQVAHWGDGGEHLHWWLYGRPSGMAQMRGSFLMVWDDLLPLRPADLVSADANAFVTAFIDEVGGECFSNFANN